MGLNDDWFETDGLMKRLNTVGECFDSLEVSRGCRRLKAWLMTDKWFLSRPARVDLCPGVKVPRPIGFHPVFNRVEECVCFNSQSWALFQFSISNFQFPILIGFYHWIASESVPVITIHFWLVQARLPGWFHDQVFVSDLLVVPIKVNWFKSLFCVNELRMIETVHLTRLLLSLSCVQNFDKLS